MKKSDIPSLLIGELSKRTGCNIETIRFYERDGIMPSPSRSSGGHRLFNENQLRRLFFIRRCRELGFTLKEIRSFLSLVDSNSYTCDQVLELTRNHVREVKQKIADLNKMKRVLNEMTSKCAGGDIPECPIIDRLFR